MGLDIWLCRHEDLIANPKLLELDEEENPNEWEKFDSETEKIEIDSKSYPEHLWKIGYFRSTYNPGGIYHVLENYLGKSFDDIFYETQEDEYKIIPNWEASRKRALDVRDSLTKLIVEKGAYEVKAVTWSCFEDPQKWEVDNEQKALKAFFDEKNLCVIRDSHYSKKTGEFVFGDPLKVVAIVTGVKKSLFHDVKVPCPYLIIETDLTWNIQALEILVETIDHVLSKPDPKNYFLYWSG